MAAPRLLGLPPVSPELKSIAPFLQRADELKTKDPIMAYWCSYYAAQVGISLKAKDTPSRNLLFELLGVLESMKKEIGPHDAIDMEAASAAYVENFGLKIFAMADNEDRRGGATRSTAKKFLAASNFLEVLRVFPKTEISESIEEKIKYAKWKAADIAKAFREGRKPTSGPAGQTEAPPQPPEVKPPTPPPFTSHPTSSTVTASSSSDSTSTHPRTSSSQSSPPSSPNHHRISPPPRMSPADIAKANLPHTPPKSSSHLGVNMSTAEGEVTPGSWSTAATPGNENFQSVDELPIHPVSQLDNRRGSASSGGSPRHQKKSSVSSGDEELMHSLRSLPHADTGKRAVHFTPSVEGGSPIVSRHDIDHINIPPSLVPDSGVDLSFGVGAAGPVIPPPPPPFQTPPDPVSPTIYRHPATFESPPRPPTYPLSYPPNASPPSHSQPHQYPYAPQPSIPAPIPPPQPVELTTSVIAKAQKHCRFAISALDYEDAAQARKELRTALAILGES